MSEFMPKFGHHRDKFREVPSDDFKEVYVNKDLHMPFKPSDLTIFLANEAGEAHSEQEATDVFLRSLPYHHRSADLGVAVPMHEYIREGGKVAAHHFYNQVDIKGGGFLFPEGFESRKDDIYAGSLAGSPAVHFAPKITDTPWGFDFLGLISTDYATSAADTTKKLAAKGMRTECVAGIEQFKKVPFGEKGLKFVDLQKMGIEALKEKEIKARESGDIESAEMYLWKVDQLKKQKFNWRPAIEVRLMRSVFRIRDLIDEANPEIAQNMLKEVCINLNKEAQNLGWPDRFDAETREGREKWLEFIIGWYGKNLGITHGEGMEHGFLHMGNLTLAGEIVDMDSVMDMVVLGHGKDFAKEPFATRYPFSKKEAYFFVNSDLTHRLPDERFKLPKCVIKDFRDLCFSVKNLVKTMRYMGDKRILVNKIVNMYKDGILENEPLEHIGIKSDKIIAVFQEIAEEIIGRNMHYPPIPPDEK